MDEQKNSLYGNRYSQLFSNGNFFAKICTKDRKSHAGIVLITSITELRLPEGLTIDGLKDNNETGTDFMKSY